MHGPGTCQVCIYSRELLRINVELGVVPVLEVARCLISNRGDEGTSGFSGLGL